MKKFYALLIVVSLITGCAKIARPPVDINGKWRRGQHAEIVIRNYGGSITGDNGSTIPVKVEYYPDKTIKISESGHTPEFIANYVPMQIAQMIYTNNIVQNTFFILNKEDEGTIKVLVNAWQVYYDYDYNVYYVMPFTNTEYWTKLN